MLVASGPLYLEFFRYMKHIFVPLFPIDVLKGIAFLVTIDRLLQRLTQGKQVVNAFIGSDQAFLEGNIL